MNSFQNRIEILCDAIIGRILSLMQVNSVSETILTDKNNRVFVIWFDKTGEPCECFVHKVIACNDNICIEVHDKITGQNHKVTSRYEAALANPVWLNEVLEAIDRILPIKDTGEEETICCKCGGKHITCEAFINPNTQEFDHYTDESFLYGWCDNCKEGTVLSNIKEVKTEMEKRFRNFIDVHKREPELAECIIRWKDSLDAEKVVISLTDISSKTDDRIFFYCKSLSDLHSLAEYGNEDFIVTECIRFIGMEQ